MQKISISSYLEKYLASNFNTYFYFKGRVALYSILKAMGVNSEDEVILPALTCVVVPNAIKYLEAKPVYVDINPSTYNMDCNQIEKKITCKTKVIIIQNTYGLTSDLDRIIDLAKKHNIYTIEDCCHGFGGTYNGKANGTKADAAFFSTQWNKPFSTGLGGFALINNEILKPKLEIFNNTLSEPSLADKIWLHILLVAKKYLVNNSTYWMMIRLYRYLSKSNLILGSSSGEELESPKMPKDYLKKMSTVQAREGISNLKKFDSLLKLRKKNALVYSRYLKNIGKTYVDEKLFNNHSFLKYPILVNDRESFFIIAEKNRVTLGDWFLSPLHPVRKSFELWDFNDNDYPVAKEIASKVLNLPTDCKDVNRIIDFLENNKEFIL